MIQPRRSSGIRITPIVIGVIAALYLARDVFIPLAFAITLTFVLAPAVAWLQKLRIGRFPATLVGACFTSLLFTIGKQLIGLYLGKASFGSTYGAAGSLVVVLVWVYYSAQLCFLWAAFTKIYTETFGSRLDKRLAVSSSSFGNVSGDRIASVSAKKSEKALSGSSSVAAGRGRSVAGG
jgi:uncharacterized BrkB/YihY/UPF0761 family membrane protein